MSEHLSIGESIIGDGHPVFIIAEIGINHNGDAARATALVDAAVEAGVDAVKFQKRDLAAVYSRHLLQYPRHGEQGVQYLLPLLQEFELSEEALRGVREHCRARGIPFMCTAFDANSVDFLETLDVAGYKIGSPDMANFPLIERMAATGKPLLISTGMSSEDEIRRMIAFLNDHSIAAGLFHCVSTYPTAPDEVNLRFMHTLAEWSDRVVGYSGHEMGIAVSTAAVAMGARMLERHITMDRTMRGPDHMASLEPNEFAALVRAVREVEAAIGSAHRWLTRGEVLNRRALAKSLVAATDLSPGTVLARVHIACRSPGLGLSPQFVDQLVGRTLRRPLRQDDPFLEEDLGVAAEVVDAAWKVDLAMPWGLIARFTDLDTLLPRFAEVGTSLVEFHVSDRDLDAGVPTLKSNRYPYDLVVHAPEYVYDELVDLCSVDDRQRSVSVERLQKTIDLARRLAPVFSRIGSRGPRVVIHVGGMADQPLGYDLDAALRRMYEALGRLDHSGVDLLLENLPPYPWYFGGRWYGFVLTDAATTDRVCRESGLGLCFDSSHAGLECNRAGTSIVEFARHVQPHIRHLHLSDAAGVSGEGLQIGEGNVPFLDLLPVLAETGAPCVPEIWMGHHNGGAGFRQALERLSELTWVCRVLARGETPVVQAALQHMVVNSQQTIASVLTTIDANRMGLVFVVGEQGSVEGVATDGDIRRGLLRGKTLQSLISEVMTRDFLFVLDDVDPAEARKCLSARYKVIPVLDSGRRLVRYHAIL